MSLQCSEVAKTAAKEEAKGVVRVAKMEKAKEAARAGMMTGVTTGVMMVRAPVEKESQKWGGSLEKMPDLAKDFGIVGSCLFLCKSLRQLDAAFESSDVPLSLFFVHQKCRQSWLHDELFQLWNHRDQQVISVIRSGVYQLNNWMVHQGYSQGYGYGGSKGGWNDEVSSCCHVILGVCL